MPLDTGRGTWLFDDETTPEERALEHEQKELQKIMATFPKPRSPIFVDKPKKPLLQQLTDKLLIYRDLAFKDEPTLKERAIDRLIEQDQCELKKLEESRAKPRSPIFVDKPKKRSFWQKVKDSWRL